MVSSVFESSLSQFLYIRELVEEVFHNLPVLPHAIAWGDSCHMTQACKEKIISKHFRSIVEPFVPDNFEQLCNILYDSKAVITGSCAITMLLGPGDHVPHDLNILVNHSTFPLIDAFFQFMLAYEWVDRDVEPHDAFGGVLECFMCYKMGNTIITVSSVNDNSLFKAVLAAPSTVDMIFMSPGGLCTFYPKLTLKHNAILSSMGLLVEPERSIGSVWSTHFEVHDDARFLTSQCGLTCPSLWRNLTVEMCWKHDTETLLFATEVSNDREGFVGKEHLDQIDDLKVNFWVNTRILKAAHPQMLLSAIFSHDVVTTME
ncbi:hypothetical protein F4604DRAFT_1674222 [Suillus subluteus]|nr:hypothetical protein F4604DRAFT_1674222 [Suillus subluteus]